MANSFQSIFEISLICLHFLKEVYAGHRILFGWFLTISSHCLLPSILLLWRNQLSVGFIETDLFSSSCFQDFLFVFDFLQFHYAVCKWGFHCILSLGFYLASWICGFICQFWEIFNYYLFNCCLCLVCSLLGLQVNMLDLGVFVVSLHFSSICSVFSLHYLR